MSQVREPLEGIVTDAEGENVYPPPETPPEAFLAVPFPGLVAEEQEQFGFVNSVILTNSYVVGATRNRWIDGAVLWLVAATVAGVMGHGLLRLALAGWRRRRP